MPPLPSGYPWMPPNLAGRQNGAFQRLFKRFLANSRRHWTWPAVHGWWDGWDSKQSKTAYFLGFFVTDLVGTPVDTPFAFRPFQDSNLAPKQTASCFKAVALRASSVPDFFRSTESSDGQRAIDATCQRSERLPQR